MFYFYFGVDHEAGITTDSSVDAAEQFRGIGQGIGGGHVQAMQPGLSQGLI